MTYRVIVVRNGVYSHTLHRSRTRDTAFIHYHKLKEANKVLFPKKYITTKGVKPVSYKICVSKETEPTDVFRTLRDEYGKMYIEKPLGDWTILDSDEYLVEETFWIYGYNPIIKKTRPNISEIVKRLMTGAHAKNMVKQIIVVHNKLLIYNENQFDMVLCKNIHDAQRLHHTLGKIAKKQKVKSLMFMGTAGPVMISRLYDLIMEKTGWNKNKVKRTTSKV